MSWHVEDAGGYLGDFATNKGVRELREHPGCPASLARLLDEGTADEALRKRIVRDCAGTRSFGYIAKLLRSAKAPVRLSDGVG